MKSVILKVTVCTVKSSYPKRKKANTKGLEIPTFPDDQLNRSSLVDRIEVSSGRASIPERKNKCSKVTTEN